MPDWKDITAFCSPEKWCQQGTNLHLKTPSLQSVLHLFIFESSTLHKLALLFLFNHRRSCIIVRIANSFLSCCTHRSRDMASESEMSPRYHVRQQTRMYNVQYIFIQPVTQTKGKKWTLWTPTVSMLIRFSYYNIYAANEIRTNEIRTEVKRKKRIMKIK